MSGCNPEIKGNQVRIGIDAPKGTKVYRDEVYEKIKLENIKASVITKIICKNCLRYGLIKGKESERIINYDTQYKQIWRD